MTTETPTHDAAGLALDRIASTTGWTETTIGSALLDVAFLVVPVGVFVTASTRFVTFQLVTTTVLSSVVLLVVATSLAELAVLDVRRRVRWTAVGLATLWLIPALVPPYL